MRKVGKRVLKPNSVFDVERLTECLESEDVKLLHLSSIWRLFRRNPEADLDELANLPKKAKRAIRDNFVGLTSSLSTVSDSQDKKTTKLLVKLQDGQQVESVIIRHSDTRGKHRCRVVLCVSSQIGCLMKCTFCATGTMGLRGQLTRAEILEQIVHANRVLNERKEGVQVRNVVFMGMGEPLDNWDEVSASLEGMLDRRLFSLGAGHITVSTVGVTSAMRRLSEEFPKINLALSLHAPTQELRLKIVPTARKNQLNALMAALHYHCEMTSNQVFIEYIAIGNVNLGLSCATQLFDLMQEYQLTQSCLINVIPYNPTDIGDSQGFEPPTEEQLKEFAQYLIDRGMVCYIRNSTTSGQDIAGACGQLAVAQESRKNQSSNKEDDFVYSFFFGWRAFLLVFIIGFVLSVALCRSFKNQFPFLRFVKG